MNKFDQLDSTYSEVLSRTGLSENEALVYGLLLKNGQLPIGKLRQIAPGLSRTNLYNVLNSLAFKKLVTKMENKKKLEFKPADPYQLKLYLTDQEKEICQAQVMLDSAISALSDMYKATTVRPVVRFYEGKEGIKRVMDDSLTSNTPILTYLDPKAVDKYLNQANRRYVSNRKKKMIPKKILVQDNEFNRQHYSEIDDELTEIRYLRYQLPTHYTVMQIYDDKISYMTIKPDSAIGLIIDDKNITTMHRALFEISWDQTGKS